MVAYFSTRDDGLERAGNKMIADLLCAVLLWTFSAVFFGWLGGTLAFLLLEAALLGVDDLMPSKDDAAGAVR